MLIPLLFISLHKYHLTLHLHFQPFKQSQVHTIACIVYLSNPIFGLSSKAEYYQIDEAVCYFGSRGSIVKLSTSLSSLLLPLGAAAEYP